MIMNCKNCNYEIGESARFCPNCGAKVVNQRLQFRQMMADMFRNLIGMDNNYVRTLKMMLLSPQVVFTDYLGGVRKRYFAPFGFFAIGAALALFVFNQFSEHYIAMSTGMSEAQVEMIDDTIEPEKKMDSEDVQAQMELNEKIQRFMLRYFNLFSFLLLPIYSLMGFIVYRKPYNFAEHLVANAYMQGVTFLFGVVFFLLSLMINPTLYTGSIVLVIFYYTYAYGKWYRLSIGKSLLKLLLFLLLLVGMAAILLLVGVIVGVIASMIAKG